MLKMYNFECTNCGHEFEALVEGCDGEPEECTPCGATTGFLRLIGAPKNLTEIIPSYPGCKARKAGYVHTHGNRPAEKGTRQVSMYSPGSKK